MTHSRNLKPQIGRLPDTDAARLMGLSDYDQQTKLLSFCYKNVIKRTYIPLRTVIYEAYQASPELLPLSKVSLEQIKRRMLKKCNANTLEMNVDALQAIFAGLEERNITSKIDNEMPLRIGYDANRGFAGWTPVLVSMTNERISKGIPLNDYRRTKGFTGDAQKIAFSLMNSGIREVDSFYDSSDFFIVQLPSLANEDRKRGFKIIRDTGVYYSSAELDDMLRHLYSNFYKVWFNEKLRREAA